MYFRKKNRYLGQHSALFFDLLLLQRTFPGVQILLLLKSPIIVRGACNTGYFDGRNTQN